MNDKARYLIKDTVIFAIGSIGSKIILFLLVPLYTNYLTSEEYGQAELVITLSQILIPIISLNVFSGVIRFGLSPDSKREDVFKSASATLLISVILTILSYPLLGVFKSVVPVRQYLCLYSFGSVILSVEMNYLKCKNMNALYALFSIIQTLVLALLNILLIVGLRLQVRGYLLANTISVYLVAVSVFIFARLYKDLGEGKMDWALTKKMLLYSTPLILNDISWWGIHSSDKIMIDLMLNGTALGLYTLAGKIPSLVNILISIFSQSWGISSIKEMDTSKDYSFLAEVFKVYSVLAFGISVFAICLIKPFIAIYVGKDFFDSWKYVPVLLVSASFSAISTYFGALYSALKKSVNSMLTTIIACLINIVVNYVCIKSFNVWGALIGTLSAYFFIATARLFDVRRFIDLKIDILRLVSNATLAILQAVLIGLDIHYWIVNFCILILFVIINGKVIFDIMVLIKNTIIKIFKF